MPKLLVNTSEIRDQFSHLERTEDNSRFYEVLSAAERLSDISADAQCVLAPGYRLLKVEHRLRLNGDEFEIALLNDVDRSVVYYNKVSITAIVDLNCRPATQNLVWRTTNARHDAVLRDTAKKVFFNYILQRYDVILSDNQQTGEGRHFWQRQMSYAIELGLHVYYYQMLTALLQSIPTQDALGDLRDKLWSEADEQQYHLALISRVELPAELLVAEAVEVVTE